MVAENSLLAYKEATENKERHYALILKCVEMHPNIDYLNISYLTGICTATITARLNELRYDFQKITQPEIKYSFADENEFYHLDYFKAYLHHMQVDSVKLITSENKEVTLVVKNRKPLEFEIV